MAKIKVYVYGTLRPGTKEVVEIPGELRDMGAFPGAILKAPDAGSFFKAEVIEVDDKTLARLDQYEGYRPDSPMRSLYLRVPYLDGYIYTYNGDMSDRPLVKDGDWLKHKERLSGSAASHFLKEV